MSITKTKFCTNHSNTNVKLVEKIIETFRSDNPETELTTMMTRMLPMRPRMRMTAKVMGTKKSVSFLIIISLSMFIAEKFESWITSSTSILTSNHYLSGIELINQDILFILVKRVKVVTYKTWCNNRKLTIVLPQSSFGTPQMGNIFLNEKIDTNE